MLKKLNSLTLLKKEDLTPNEEILVTKLQSWWIEIKNILISVGAFLISIFLLVYYLFSSERSLILVMFSIICFLAFFFLAILIIWSHYSIRYYLTSERILMRSGIFSKHIRAVPYEKIQDTQLKKTFFENVADIGDIFINVAGSSEVELKIENVDDPEKIYALILEKMNEKRGKTTGI